jgi:hypothetical protein
MPEPSILDARLAEIDRRLRMIQSGLEPVRDEPAADDPSPPRPDLPVTPAPTPLYPSRLAGTAERGPDDEVTVLTARLSELTVAHERLLAATQDLLIEQADVLARAAPAVSVAAGPFTDTAALAQFQSAVAELPQVREVTIREYVGSERAVLDVHLVAAIS